MKKAIKIVFSVSFIVYLFVLASILFLGSRGFAWDGMSLTDYIRQSSNFIPFKTISMYFQALSDGRMNMDIPIKNLLGNFVLFMPMGVYLPFFIRKKNSIILFTVSMTAMLITIEIIQVITRRGSFDIDDYILNMLGALIGYGIGRSGFAGRMLR
ncbi:VanZ family protein [Bacillus infantis]|uniref:VanZ family protein n=1 Tax=Bacillus infantis TaxID=324767 RepID=UPI002002C719|nr:VanZ family protein [Bacillus infantis]MCK6206476.1 VanZ family protein [Bacillus infantis]